MCIALLLIRNCPEDSILFNAPMYGTVNTGFQIEDDNSVCWREVQITKLFIMQFHSLSYYFQMQKSKYTEQHYSHISSTVFPQSHTPSFIHPHL
jgi:hypothetical protein